MQQKRDFGSAPTGYIPGFGRGAVGFITRSDIGPAKLNDPLQTERGRQKQDDDDDREDYNDAKYDQWNGYQIPLFNHAEYDDEDREADQMYEMVDELLEGRRKHRKEKIQKAELKKIRSERPNFSQQFADLKRDLAKLTNQEWMSIPEAVDYKVKKVKTEKYVPNTDAILDSVRRQNEMGTTVENEQDEILKQNLNEVGEVRGTLLSLKLDGMQDGVAGQSNVDKKGYLTDLQSLPFVTREDIGDFKKARLLLKSLIQSNPNQAYGWLAAARVEELDGKIQQAKNILAQGLEKVEENEYLWIECARLESYEKGKQILAKAVTVHPQSVQIWLATANKEPDRAAKIKRLKRALEFIPNSERLWKEIIELSTEQEARILLHKAVECIPSKLEFWLALARLETYEEAKAVLNKARFYLPSEPSIWINAAKLEESAGKDNIAIATVLSKAIKVLTKNGAKIVRDDWLGEAELSEKSENYQTCFALVRACLGLGVSEEDREKTWIEDADLFVKRDSFFTARAILNYSAEVLPDKQNIYTKLLEFEEKYSSKKYPTQENYNFIPLKPEDVKKHWYFDQALDKATKDCPQHVDFWIKSIMRKFEIGFIEFAKETLAQSEISLPNNERLLTLSGKLEAKNGNLERYPQSPCRSRIPLTKALECCGGIRSWIYMIKLELLCKNLEEAERLANEASIKYPASEKLWILWGTILFKQGKPDEARKIYLKAEELLPQHVGIWIQHIFLECELGLYSRARAVLDKAKSKLNKNPDLFITAVKLELASKNKKAAIIALNKGLQQCPQSGELWSLAIQLEPKNTRKKKSADALTVCPNDPYVYLSTAQIFWRENKQNKMLRSIEQAIKTNPRLGDAWALYYLQSQEDEDREQIIKKCIENKPKYGRLWEETKKSDISWSLSTKDILLQVVTKTLNELKQLD